MNFLATDRENNGGAGSLPCFAMLRQRYKCVLLFVLGDAFFADQSQDVFVKYFAFTVCQFFESRESRIQFCFAFKQNTQLLQALFERIATA